MRSVLVAGIKQRSQVLSIFFRHEANLLPARYNHLNRVAAMDIVVLVASIE